MIANFDMFQEMMQDMMQPQAVRQHPVKSERSVKIYSDMPDTVYEGDLITMSAELTGYEGLDITMQWQYDDGMYWVDVPGATALHHSFAATAETIDYSWRVSVTIHD